MVAEINFAFVVQQAFMSIIHAMNTFKSKINKIIAGISYTTGHQLLKLQCKVLSYNKEIFCNC
jgi:hypothetical protein